MMKSQILLPSIDIKKINDISRAAGEIHMYYYSKNNIGVNYKSDNSPVTIADTESNKFICKELSNLYPNIPIISEENEISDIKHDIFWLIDPLDGTKSFIKRKGEFTVNIGLVCNKKPIIGVVYASLSNQLYYVGGDKVPYKESLGKIKTREAPTEGLTVLTSAFFNNNKKMNDYLKNKNINKVINESSSLKICLIAEGSADLYPRFGQTMEWDTAAAHAILKAAGGSIKDFEGNDLNYGNIEKKYYNPSFIAKGYN